MVDVNGKLYSIFDFKKPKNQNYIIIEVLGMPVGKNFSVIKIPDNYIIEVGRSNSELNIPDVSVSKKQATLKYDLSINELVLTDVNSKYGTHLLIQRPIELTLNTPMYFLNGLSLIQLTLKRVKQNQCLECLPSQKKNKFKYLKDYKGLYNDVKHQMPEDLLKYEHEEQSDIMMNRKLFDKERFKNASVHLMPLTANAFYTKVMKYQNEYDKKSDNDAASIQENNARLVGYQTQQPSMTHTLNHATNLNSQASNNDLNNAEDEDRSGVVNESNVSGEASNEGSDEGSENEDAADEESNRNLEEEKEERSSTPIRNNYVIESQLQRESLPQTDHPNIKFQTFGPKKAEGQQDKQTITIDESEL